MRRYHSPSSIALGARCQHAWALCYIDGVRDPELTWEDIEAERIAFTSRQRSTALGKATHAVYEQHYTRGKPNWRGLPGQIALSGAHLLPHPTALEWAPMVEDPIGDEQLPPDPDARPGSPTLGMRVHGVFWAGFKDLVVHPTRAELTRLSIDAPHGLLLGDYKTTASIDRYALTSEQLLVDVQANLYAFDVSEGFGVDRVPCRWLYLESKMVRRARPTDALIYRDDALALLEPHAKLARELDALTSSADAPKNPLACGDYGGCPHHISVGGPCNARRSVGALIQARAKKKDPINMALTKEAQAKFDALRKGAKPAAVAEPPAENDGPETDEGEGDAEPPAETPAPRAQAPRQRAPRQTPAGARKPAAAPASGPVGEVLALAAELHAARAVCEAATAEVDAIMAKIAAASTR